MLHFVKLQLGYVGHILWPFAHVLGRKQTMRASCKWLNG